ncbi:MAG: molybdopterin-guanine dinucleotide biosynthesis protein MobB, partial [Peptococcaceae bacterium]|nr:molybdopterin-guanine dinucleotide biosynthesis protein MobB [Peptococcaceae bacterium]
LEGLKYSTWPKIEIIRAGNSAQPVCSSDTLLALVTDVPNIQSNVPILDVNEIDGVVKVILQYRNTKM